MLQVICWRDVPTDNTRIGQVAQKCEPYMRQVFVTGDQDDVNLERQVGIKIIFLRYHTRRNYFHRIIIEIVI